MAALPNIRPRAPLYLPPGKTSDLGTWKKDDVFNWMTFFLPEELRQKTIDTLQELEPFDGDVLKVMYQLRPQGDIFGISQEAMDLIRRHLEPVVRTFRLLEAQSKIGRSAPPPNPVKETPLSNKTYPKPRH